MENLQTDTAALIVKRILPFPPEVIFQAFSDAKVMSRWFVGMPRGTAKVTNDFRVGKDFSIEMRSEKGEIYPHTGTYKEIVPGEKIVFTWNSHVAKDTVVTVQFSKVKDGTEVTLIHEFLADDMRQPHNQGWNHCLDNLEPALAAATR